MLHVQGDGQDEHNTVDRNLRDPPAGHQYASSKAQCTFEWVGAVERPVYLGLVSTKPLVKAFVLGKYLSVIWWAMGTSLPID
mmetsp:Transcript_122970/g.393957  ORF Transcript_122970/g.393957 Transcript_122970/m.393957 type:complete len:82 (-) Transcript_122970:496-741(-)